MIVSFFIAHSLIVEAYQAVKEYFNAEDKEDPSGADELSPPTGSTDSVIIQQTPLELDENNYAKIRQTPVSSDEETPEDAVVEEQIPVTSNVEKPEEAASEDQQIPVTSNEEKQITVTSMSTDERKTKKIDMTGKTEIINNSQYEIGKMLGEGAYGVVFEGTRVHDGLKVVVKFVEKEAGENDTYVKIPDENDQFPKEIGFHILSNREPKAPEILQILDWEDHPNRYVMVLENFTPCMDIADFMNEKDGFTEDLAKVVMRQAITAANECARRGVYHGDIKLENFIINTETHKIKLFDFGQSSYWIDSPYNTLAGTPYYLCPEALKGSYCADTATVYSLGAMLFIMICEELPSRGYVDLFNKDISVGNMSKDCYSLIQACMWYDPMRRIKLAEMLNHEWFKVRKGAQHRRRKRYVIR